MSKRIVFLAVLLALAPLVAFADTPQAEPATDQQPPAEKAGLMTRFAKLFEPLDTTRPENQHVFVIGGSHNTTPDVPAAADKPASVASTAPASSASAADATGTAQADAPAATAKPSGHGFKLTSGFDSGEAPKPDGQAATPPQ